MADYDKLQELIGTLTELAQKAESTGETGMPGDVSGKAEAWVNDAVKKLEEIIWNLKDTLDVREMEYGPMTPAQAASIIRQIAAAIKNSKNPQRDLVIEDIRKVIAAVGK